MKIETKFAIKDRVWINELRTPATVLAIYIAETGVQYSCRWFDSKSSNTAYFYESEVSSVPEQEVVGFNNATKTP